MSDRVKNQLKNARRVGMMKGFGARKEALPPNFYDWKKHFPQLQVLIDNIDVLIKEMKVCLF